MAMAMEREADEMSSSSVFTSLMPDILNMTHHFDDSITEQGFLEVDRLLTEVIMEKRTVDGTIIKENPEFMKLSNFQAKGISVERTIDEPMTKACPQFMKLKDAEDAGILAERSSKKEFDNFFSGKENISPQRNTFSRCERDLRIISIKKPFTVDVRSFGSILNSEEVGREPSDKREGGESCESRDINIANSSFTRVGFRRKNCRRTRRLKRFSVEVPFCSEDIRSLDDELLEEECETESSSFTFISGLEKIHQELNDRNEVHTSQYSSVMQSDEISVDVRDLNVGAENYHDILSHCKLPAMNSYWNYTCINNDEQNTILTEGEQNESSKQPENIEIVQNIDIFDDEIHVENKTDDDDNIYKNTGEENDHVVFSHCKIPAMDSNWNNECTNLEQKNATPTEGEQNEGSKQPNDMELVQNINVSEDQMHVNDKTDDGDRDNSLAAAADKNKRDDTNGNVNDVDRKVTHIMSERTHFTSSTPPSNAFAGLALSSKDVCVEAISKGEPEAVLNGIIDPPVEMSMVLDPCMEMNQAPILEIPLLISNSSHVQEQNLDLAEESNSIASNEIIMNGEGNKTMCSQRQSQKHVVMNWGGNYEGAGTNWNEGVRRSTRIRSRPLEWWRGERFLLDCVHKRDR